MKRFIIPIGISIIAIIFFSLFFQKRNKLNQHEIYLSKLYESNIRDINNRIETDRRTIEMHYQLNFCKAQSFYFSQRLLDSMNYNLLSCIEANDQNKCFQRLRDQYIDSVFNMLKIDTNSDFQNPKDFQIVGLLHDLKAQSISHKLSTLQKLELVSGLTLLNLQVHSKILSNLSESEKWFTVVEPSISPLKTILNKNENFIAQVALADIHPLKNGTLIIIGESFDEKSKSIVNPIDTFYTNEKKPNELAAIEILSNKLKSGL